MGFTIYDFIFAFTCLPIIVGGLLGLIRGRNRSILRLVLVVLCAIITVLSIKPLIGIIMEYEVEGLPLKEYLTSMLMQEGTELPQEITNLIFMIVEMILGVVLYFVVFLVLKFITWLILFPILKIFVRKGAKKGVLTGLLFGLLQGVVVAFLICAPVTGFVGQFAKLSSVDLSKIAGEGSSISLPTEELGLDDCLESPIYKVYSSTGNWLFEVISSTTDSKGNKVSLGNTIDVLVTVVEVAGGAQDLGPTIEQLTKEDITPEERTDALKDLGDNLISIGNSINDLDDGGKAIINEVIGAVGGLLGEEVPEEIAGFIESFDVDNIKLASAGEAIKGIASYVEKTTEGFEEFGQEVTQTEVSSIINGLADNSFILDLFAGENADSTPAIVEISDSHAEMFEQAISSNTTLDDNQKEIMRKLLGI